MYLPAFPAIEASFGGQHGAAQVTLAAWFAGLAVGQVTQGTLADRYGRRLPLIVGTAFYALATMGCALSSDLSTLSIMRFVSAFGGSASMVITRAIVRDLADGHAAAKLMSKLILVMGVAPILAPSLGGFILIYSGWQGIFWFCAGFGLLSFLGVMFLLPETLPETGRVRLGFGGQMSRYASIVAERGFITHALMGGFAMFGMFAFLAGSPPVFIEHFHLSPQTYGLLFGCSAAGFILASQINPRILPLLGADRVLTWSVRTFLIATVVLTVMAFGQWLGVLPDLWWLIGLPIAISMATQGFTMPNATVGALSRHAAHAGSASALLGTLQFSLAATSGLLAGMFSDGTARPMALLMLTGALGATICEVYRPRRR
jgi:DHA1 family bicyclomycin/chloramphenicol resistance-like MFS transporter